MKKLLIIIALFAFSKSNAQSIYRQNGEDYANIDPILMTGMKKPVYLTRLHVSMPNDGTTANITYELQYSLDSITYVGSCMHSGKFSFPVDGDTPPNSGKQTIFNYIRTLNIKFDWE